MKIPYRSLTFWIFVGLFGGMFAGQIFGEAIVPIAQPLSDIFLRLLRMAVMPLVMALATRYQKLLPAEALNAATINAAQAIDGTGDIWLEVKKTGRYVRIRIRDSGSGGSSRVAITRSSKSSTVSTLPFVLTITSR